MVVATAMAMAVVDVRAWEMLVVVPAMAMAERVKAKTTVLCEAAVAMATEKGAEEVAASTAVSVEVGTADSTEAIRRVHKAATVAMGAVVSAEEAELAVPTAEELVLLVAVELVAATAEVGVGAG